MKVRISSRSAESCLLLPSPISLSKKREETLVPLPLQHRSIRRRWLQRRRLRMKAMVRPIISAEMTTEDDIKETKDNDKPTDPKSWELALESTTDDDDTKPVEALQVLSESKNRKKRSAEEPLHKFESKSQKKRLYADTKPKAPTNIAEKMTLILAAAGKEKRRLHRDVASLVSPMRSSKRQRFDFST